MPVSMIDVSTPDGVADAHLATPGSDERLPGLLFIMDAYGLRPQIETMVDRIASHGYVVVAPNVFYRAGRARWCRFRTIRIRTLVLPSSPRSGP